jgi:maltose O-acetyltransferase
MVYIIIKTINYFVVVKYKILYSDNYPIINNANINLPTQFVGKGKIELTGCQLGVWPSPHFINGFGYIEARSNMAEVKIGVGTTLNNNYTIISDKCKIIIGKNCQIGQNIFITDSDFHGIEIKNRNTDVYNVSSVIIGDNVFIGSNVKILKGVKIKNGSIIGCGSVVVSEVEEMSIYAGVPAKKIGTVPRQK